jgi:hypothetical protein
MAKQRQQYEAYKLSPLAELVAFSQLNRNKIRIEFQRLKYFYDNNHDAFFYSLKDTKDKLEAKEDKTDFDHESIQEIERLLENKEEAIKRFFYREELLLDTYQKIFLQLMSDIEKYENDEPIEVMYYTLDKTARMEDVPVGQFFSDGTLNTGSQLKLELIKVYPREFTTNYRILHN